ncbi:AP-3 complex subunit mu-2 [Entophlyctis sp. JEL0112]|nr:AP-3 complex subunit mu-2 [Entophlyctis sp. JEL0112]
MLIGANDPPFSTPLIEKLCRGYSPSASDSARRAVALVFEQISRSARLRTVPVAADSLAAVVTPNTINLNNINVGQLASTAGAAAVSAAATTTAAAASALNSLSSHIPSLSNLASSIPTVQQPPGMGPAGLGSGAFFIGGDGGVIVNETNVFDVIPMASSDSYYLVHIQRNGLFFVALFKEEVQLLQIVEFLQRIVDILIDYFGEVSEIVVKEHFVVVYELLEEMLDNGHPYITEPAILKDMVPPPSLLASMMKAVSLGPNNFAPTGLFSQVPWRSSGIKHPKNEFYMDLIETLNVVMDKFRIPVKRQGMPDLTLNFQNPRLFEDMMTSFHPCVRYYRFEKDSVVSFIPPDGDFKLMDYVLPLTNSQHLPVIVKPQIQFTKAGGTLQMSVKSQSTGGKFLEQVIVTLTLPQSITSAKIDSSVGSVQYDPNARKMRWIISKISPDMPAPTLTGQLFSTNTEQSSPMNADAAIVEEVLGTYVPKKNKGNPVQQNGSQGKHQPTQEKDHGHQNGKIQQQRSLKLTQHVLEVSPLIDIMVEFKVAMHTVSGVKVDQLNVLGESYLPFKVMINTPSRR